MGSSPGPFPSIEIYRHVDFISEAECERLKVWTLGSLPKCLNAPGPGNCDLPALQEIEISVVSDETIAAVHSEFLDDPTPTDVITFPHGEILISYDTAFRFAGEQGHSVLDELFLYIVHGLLHLNGHLDHDLPQRVEMHRIQDQIWNERETTV